MLFHSESKVVSKITACKHAGEKPLAIQFADPKNVVGTQSRPDGVEDSFKSEVLVSGSRKSVALVSERTSRVVKETGAVRTPRNGERHETQELPVRAGCKQEGLAQAGKVLPCRQNPVG